jgi:hypothetical protein
VVAGVQDSSRVGGRDAVEERARQPAAEPGQVRVGDRGDDDRTVRRAVRQMIS